MAGISPTARRRPPDKVDFSDAAFRRVEFLGFDLDAVTLPKDPDIRLVRRARCVARRGLDLLDGDGRTETRMLRAMFENRLRGPGTDNESAVFNRRDYLELGGPQLLALAEDVLTRAEAECSADSGWRWAFSGGSLCAEGVEQAQDELAVAVIELGKAVFGRDPNGAPPAALIRRRSQ
jgi:hypothetical protein